MSPDMAGFGWKGKIPPDQGASGVRAGINTLLGVIAV